MRWATIISGPYWYEEVTGGRFVAKSDGKLGALQYEHDQKLTVTIEKKHPVTAGLGSFTVQDETYEGMWISPKVEVLLRTNHPLRDGPLAWIAVHTATPAWFAFNWGTISMLIGTLTIEGWC